MPLKIGSTNISAVYAGSTKVARIYKGAALVYSSETWASLALENVYETLIDPGYGNQLIDDHFETSSITYWNKNRLTQTNSGGVATFVANSNAYASVSFFHYYSAGILVKDHKYFAYIELRKMSGNCNSIQLYMHSNRIVKIDSPVIGQWYKAQGIWTNNRENNTTVNAMATEFVYASTSDVGVNSDTYQAKNPYLFDLTAIFGAGNEPTATNDPRIKLLKQQKAKALRFDEVYGNGIVMNQLVQNGNFESVGNWHASDATLSVSDNKLILTKTADGNSIFYLPNADMEGLIVAGHKYLVSAKIKPSRTVNVAAIVNVNGNTYSMTANNVNSLVDIVTTTGTSGFLCAMYFGGGVLLTGDTVEVSNYQMFDLTLMFGTGNEPTSTDDPRVKKLISEYHRNIWQMVDINTTSQTQTVSGLTVTDHRNGTYTVSGTATANVNKTIGKPFASIANHVYLLGGCPSGGSSSTYRIVEGYTYRLADTGSGSINTLITDGVKSVIIDIKSGMVCNDLVFRPQFYDLTASFGAGNEPTSVNDPRVVALISSYHDYGNVNHYELTDITSVWTEPFNVFDGQWDVGNFDNNYTTNAKSINYLPVCGGETYIFDNGDLVTTNSNGFYYQEFDEDFNALNATRIALYDVFASANKQTEFTVKPGCRYIRFFVYIANYDFTHNFPQHVTIRRKSNRLGYHMLPDVNLLASLSSRSKGTLSGFANTTPRTFSESEYYVGLTRDNYYEESGVGSYSVSANSVTVTSANSGYGVAFPVKAFPNASYSFSCSASPSSAGNTGIGVTFYDGTGNIISYTQQEDSATSKSLSGTAPSNCAWISILFYATSAAGATTYGNISLNVTPIYQYDSTTANRNLCDKKSFSQYDYSYDYLKYNANNAVFLQAGTYTFTTGHGVYIQFYNSPSDSDYIMAADAISYYSNGTVAWGSRVINLDDNDTQVTLTLKTDCFVTICGKNNVVIRNPMINAGNVAYPYAPYDDEFIPDYLDGQKSILGVQNVPFTYGANAANVTFYPRTDGSFAVGSSDALRKNAKKISGHKYFIMITVDNAVYSWAYLGIWDTTSTGYDDRLAPTQIGNDFYALVTATSSVDNAVPTFQFGGTNNTAMTCRRAIILDVTGTPLENQSSHKIYAMLKGVDDLAAGLELHCALEMAQWPHVQLNGAIDAHDSLKIPAKEYDSKLSGAKSLAGKQNDLEWISNRTLYNWITVGNESWAYYTVCENGKELGITPSKQNQYFALITKFSTLASLSSSTILIGNGNNYNFVVNSEYRNEASNILVSVFTNLTQTGTINQFRYNNNGASLQGTEVLAYAVIDLSALGLDSATAEQVNAMLKGGAFDALASGEILNSYVFTKRVANVDMSKINWSYQSDHGRFYSNGVQSLIKGNTNGAVVPNISCPKLTSISLNNVDTSDNVASVYNNFVFFRSTSAGTTNQEAQAFLSGAILHYELATPQEISIPKERMAVVDLGSLGNWGHNVAYGHNETTNTGIGQMIQKVSGDAQKANIYCSKYVTNSRNSISDMQISINALGTIIINDSILYPLSSNEIQGKLSGEYLFFETTYPMLEETEYEASVDLGTLDDAYMSNDIYYCSGVLKPPFAYPTASTANDGYKATIKGYTRAKGNEVAAKTNDKTFCLTSPYLGGNLAIYDSAFAGKTINEVKAMLSGKKIVFETAAKASTPQHSVMKVDLGTLNWSAMGTGANDRTGTSGLASIISRVSGNGVIANLYCDQYIASTANGTYLHTYDKSISSNAGGGDIQIYNSSFAGYSGDEIKAALSGVYLYFDSVVQKARIPNEVKAEYGGVVSTDSEVLPDADISLKF